MPRVAWAVAFPRLIRRALCGTRLTRQRASKLVAQPFAGFTTISLV